MSLNVSHNVSQNASQSLLPFVFPPPGASRELQQRQLVALTDSSNHLRDLQNKLRLVQRQAITIPQFNPMPPRLVDDRMTGTFTKTRKSYVVPVAPDRMRSEWYPLSNPPFNPFATGQNTRYIGRDPQVRYK